MSNWIAELECIILKLELNDLANIKEQLKEAQLSGGTGGEIFLLVASKLKEIRLTNPREFEFIKKESNNIFKFGVDEGILSDL